ncbi:hypothetical protein RSOLAG22IIIB_12371 [Rhizoctonia solani]|uniref:Uncharacterized protein n=1 Tax=Rhizoctonia solani TaxID=456999 RepID=A0A0K6GDJ6_9AGAM|nr:hypothetical protein RSOLAG22IIIB_12371 [Rhizoctonia solani]
MNDQANIDTNNLGTGADTRTTEDVGVRDALERSNRLAEQANLLVERTNLLIERSNEIAERVNRLVERPTPPPEQSNPLAARFNELFEKLNNHFEDSNQHSERSNHIIEALANPVVKFGDILQNINGVLVGIQHAIVRSHKRTTWDALDCLVNQKGETPIVSLTTKQTSFRWMVEMYGRQPEYLLSVVLNGVPQDYWIPDGWLGEFLRFYGIGEGLCKGETSIALRENKEEEARQRLSAYLSSCLG